MAARSNTKFRYIDPAVGENRMKRMNSQYCRTFFRDIFRSLNNLVIFKSPLTS